MNKTIIDYLSFTGSPELLLRLREVAKQNMKFKIQNTPMQEGLWMSQEIQKDAFFSFLGAELGNLDSMDYLTRSAFETAAMNALDDADFELSDCATFNQTYIELIQNIGIDMLDCLCHGEINAFMELLNTEITVPGNVWEFDQKPGGWSGYTHSAKLLCNGTQAGLIAWGAKNFGFYISFSGVGCAAIQMPVMHKCIKQIPGAKITRCDIALDDFDGKITVDEMKGRYMGGQFITRGTPPKYAYFEGGELQDNHKGKQPYKCMPVLGRSFYVGKRENGKMCRTYEKGKQLKSEEFPNWVRVELELHNKSREIPADILINSDDYFAGAYPALFAILPEVERVAVITTTKRAAKTLYTNAVQNLRNQYGKMINLMRLVTEDDRQIIEILTRGLGITEIPERFNIPVVQGTT